MRGLGLSIMHGLADGATPVLRKAAVQPNQAENDCLRRAVSILPGFHNSKLIPIVENLPAPARFSDLECALRPTGGVVRFVKVSNRTPDNRRVATMSELEQRLAERGAGGEYQCLARPFRSGSRPSDSALPHWIAVVDGVLFDPELTVRDDEMTIRGIPLAAAPEVLGYESLASIWMLEVGTGLSDKAERAMKKRIANCSQPMAKRSRK